MKKQTLFKSFTLVSLLFSGSAFATTNPEEAIVGKWGYTRTFCEQGTKSPDTLSQDQIMILTFDKMGTGQVQMIQPNIIGESCAISAGLTMSYSIDGDMINFSFDAQTPVISSPDCPEVQDIIDNVVANPQKIDSKSNTVKFAITSDGTQLQIIRRENNTACGENDKPIIEHKKLQL